MRGVWSLLSCQASCWFFLFLVLKYRAVLPSCIMGAAAAPPLPQETALSPWRRLELRCCLERHQWRHGETVSDRVTSYLYIQYLWATGEVCIWLDCFSADRGVSRSGDRQEVSRPDPFLSVRPVHAQHRGQSSSNSSDDKWKWALYHISALSLCLHGIQSF